MSIGATNPNKKHGICEVCDNEADLTLHYGNMYFCDDCWEKEQKFTAENSTPEAVQKRVEATYANNPVNQALAEAKQIDDGVQVRTDLFNAATVAIMELKKSIDEDATITNKPFALASALKDRFIHFKQVVFELNQQIIDAGNQQKAIQSYLNTLANQLRAEEREKLRIADINYRPAPMKSPTVKKVGTTQTNKKTKIDKTELRKFAGELGVSEFTLQMIVVQKGITVAEAAMILKRSIEAGKKEA